jgi:hypothetical protein
MLLSLCVCRVRVLLTSPGECIYKTIPYTKSCMQNYPVYKTIPNVKLSGILFCIQNCLLYKIVLCTKSCILYCPLCKTHLCTYYPVYKITILSYIQNNSVWKTLRYTIVSIKLSFGSRYFFLQVALQLYSRGWVDPVPDPLLLRKSGSAGNRTRSSGSVARNSDH